MLKVPLRMLQWMTPSSRDSTGSTEYLEKNELVLMISHFAWPDLPLATTKKGFPGSLSTMYGPGPSMVSCAVIDSTLIHKDKLISLISAYASHKICSFLSTSLNCSVRELFCMLVLLPCDQELILHTFFILYPPLLSVLQIVDVDTDTPYLSWSSNPNSLRYRSGVLLRVLKRCFIA
jgi:hypothetical protein